jgi:DNA-binding FadR family transcriptional regulator
MRTYRHFEELILDTTLQPGNKVPFERQLVQRLKAFRLVIMMVLMVFKGVV